MTTPPDFGGTEIEKGVAEDLGAELEERGEAGHDDTGTAPRSDHEAHAPGEVCARCRQVIAPGQDVRRRLDGSWVHEICP